MGNSANVAHSCQQKPRRQTQRHELYKKLFKGSHESPAKVSVATSKKTVLSSSVAQLIGQTDLTSGRRQISCLSSDLKTVQSIIESIQGADHHITPELQQAIVTEALKKKIRHRERCRINQARYRQRQMQVETGIEDQINKLKAEIKGLERKSTDTVLPPSTPTNWPLASEFFRLLNYYMSSPGTLYKMASKFLNDTMAADGIDGATYGPEATSVTITDNTLRRAFPHLNSDGVGVDKGGVWSPVAAKMLNKKIVMQGSVTFGWDRATEKVTSIYAQADLVTPLLNLLGSLEDVSCAFYKARVTPDCRFVRGS
ncbi:uncharacterized protein PITG_07438 [Phytophthora infestans T30-4]|uniref:Bzip transcription factor n=1 Tax=Phytophthora infestans (strain T30-4) TaxID=403677 RepID=D0N8E9_PHYIT|nr:uncharacterized protein PITG_07438 [Phytophthora infestans T30-4]EEY53834.1 conserved hypothetical protein [Phytophthora infestans T30-4]|eukprot:XP_002904465.1 conserved hypothetical protein [Phytophthora infestans T30-4]